MSAKFLSDKKVHELQQRGDVVTIEGRLFVALEAVEEHAAPTTDEKAVAAPSAGEKKSDAKGS